MRKHCLCRPPDSGTLPELFRYPPPVMPVKAFKMGNPTPAAFPRAYAAFFIIKKRALGLFCAIAATARLIIDNNILRFKKGGFGFSGRRCAARNFKNFHPAQIIPAAAARTAIAYFCGPPGALSVCRIFSGSKAANPLYERTHAAQYSPAARAAAPYHRTGALPFHTRKSLL